MGLLDDAIREHLELKRRRGADPGEIAHQERAALEPVFPPEETAADDHPQEHAEDGHVPDVAPADAALEHADAGLLDGHPPAEPALADFSGGGQETAELDMEAMLEQDGQHQLDGSVAPVPAGPAAAAPSRAPLEEEDSLDWETPGTAEDGHIPGEVPGQEHLSFE
jgi:hypothetical protein